MSSNKFYIGGIVRIKYGALMIVTFKDLFKHEDGGAGPYAVITDERSPNYVFTRNYKDGLEYSVDKKYLENVSEFERIMLSVGKV